MNKTERLKTEIEKIREEKPDESEIEELLEILNEDSE